MRKQIVLAIFLVIVLSVYYDLKSDPTPPCRFQILRDLIPHSDQKRDKASFLLEVAA